MRSAETWIWIIFTALRRILAPEILHEAIHRHRAVRVEQEPREQRPRRPAPEGDRAPFELDLEWPEEAREHGSALGLRPHRDEVLGLHQQASVGGLVAPLGHRVDLVAALVPAAFGVRRSRALRVGP